MSTMIERMDDAKFNVLTPLCHLCRNLVRHKFDPRKPMDPVMSCAVLGEIPKDIEDAKQQSCETFGVNRASVELNRELLTKEQLEYVADK